MLIEDYKEKEIEKTCNSLFRQDLSSFIEKCFKTVNPGTIYQNNWHIDLLAEYLTACDNGEIKKLIINLPPRSLKSLCVSVAWPAWLLGADPARRIIVASYAQHLSEKHSLDSRLIINSAWYKNIFPNTEIASGENKKHKFVTTMRGFRMAASVGGSITGEGGNFLIVDDPHNPVHMFSETWRNKTLNWFDQVFLSRADDKNKAVFLVVMQRLHADDLTAYLLKKNSGWEHLKLPAIEERESEISFHDFYKLRRQGEPLNKKREDIAKLENIKNDIGSAIFSAQYQQLPFLRTGNIIKEKWLKYYSEFPEDIKKTAQSWDTAIKATDKNDYTVCTTWGEAAAGYYLLDVKRIRLEYPDLKKLISAHAEKWNADVVLIEDKASGQSLIQDLKRETRLPIIGINPCKDKITRMSSCSALFEAGKVFLPRLTPWLAAYETELVAFPFGSFDDQVDATSQFLNWAKYKGSSKPGVRKI